MARKASALILMLREWRALNHQLIIFVFAIRWGADQLGLESSGKQHEIKQEDSEQLAKLLEPLLKRIRLEAIPPTILEQKVEALGLLSKEELLKVALTQRRSLVMLETFLCLCNHTTRSRASL